MTKREKLVERFLKMPPDFHYNEIVKLLGYFDFYPVKTGKTSGSRVKFENASGVPVMLYKPHPDGLMKKYQLKQIKELLEL
ncbi:MAG: type II toxin-antitoxin system HicA family toxin [Anditalea sp.]